MSIPCFLIIIKQEILIEVGGLGPQLTLPSALHCRRQLLLNEHNYLPAFSTNYIVPIIPQKSTKEMPFKNIQMFDLVISFLLKFSPKALCYASML